MNIGRRSLDRSLIRLDPLSLLRFCHMIVINNSDDLAHIVGPCLRGLLDLGLPEERDRSSEADPDEDREAHRSSVLLDNCMR